MHQAILGARHQIHKATLAVVAGGVAGAAHGGAAVLVERKKFACAIAKPGSTERVS